MFTDACGKCNEYGYMKYLSSSRLACHVTSRVVNHLVVLLLLLIAINKFCFADFVVYPHVVTWSQKFPESTLHENRMICGRRSRIDE